MTVCLKIQIVTQISRVSGKSGDKNYEAVDIFVKFQTISLTLVFGKKKCRIYTFRIDIR